MVKLIEDWMAAHRGKQVVNDVGGFWRGLGMPDNPSRKKSNLVRLAQYLANEDGSTKLPPLRTGKEVALYRHVREFVECGGCTRESPTRGQTIGMDRLLSWALDDAGTSGGDVNLQSVFLTIHNVERLLARPQQWSGDGVNGLRPGTNMIGHPATDPVRPIIDDLRGLRGLDGGKTFAETMQIRRRPKAEGPQRPAGETLQPLWSMNRLYNSNGGFFQTQPGITSALSTGSPLGNLTTEWNAGSHYYYWIGAFARSTAGWEAVFQGARGELDAKAASGNTKEERCVRKAQGEVEVSQLICGSMFAAEALRRVKTPQIGCGLGFEWQLWPGEFWRRKGDTNEFYIYSFYRQAYDPGKVTMVVSGDQVKIRRQGASDKNDCEIDCKLEWWSGNGDTTCTSKSHRCSKPFQALGSAPREGSDNALPAVSDGKQTRITPILCTNRWDAKLP